MTRFFKVMIFGFVLTTALWAQSWKSLNTGNSALPSNAVVNIFFDPDGSIWYCTQDSGLVHSSNETYRVYNSASNDGFVADYVNAIVKSGNDDYWIATEYHGLYHFQNGAFTQYLNDGQGHDLRSLRCLALQGGGPANGGSVWIGTWGHGLFRFDGSDWHYFDQASGALPDNSVHALAVEEEANGQSYVVWAGTGNGLMKYDGSQWENFSVGNQNDQWINAIALENGGALLNGGKMYVGTESGEFAMYDGSQWTIFNMADAWNPNNSVTSIAIDADGIKWFGTYNEGLGMYDGKQLLLYYKDNSGIAGNDVVTVAVRRVNDSTQVWCSVYDSSLPGFAGISIYTKPSVTGMEAVSQLPDRLYLFSNYPNPFNSTTTIHFRLTASAQVSLQIFDLSGRLVRTLFNGKRAAGDYRFKFKANDLASGLYFCRLSAGRQSSTRKIILLK